MIARTIEYNVNIDGILPKEEQFGGMQGDHNVTSLYFVIQPSIFDDFAGHITIQITDGAGGYHEYETSAEGQDEVSFLIPKAVTNAGGIANCCLVFTNTKTVNNEIVSSEILYSFPFKLRFKDTLTVGTPSQQEFLEDGASILANAKKYEQDTLKYRNETENLIMDADNIIPILEQTTEDANNVELQLRQTKDEAKDIHSNLKLNVKYAQSLNDELESTVVNARAINSSLLHTVEESGNAYSNLQREIKQAEEVQTSLRNDVSYANSLRSSLNTATTNARAVSQTLSRENKFAEDNIETLESLLGNTNTVIEGLNNIDEALDRIIAIQESYIGGEA
jgi:uncharacterized alpha-E superfamily protein